MVGSLGDAEVFSLHATKIVHGFEGGVLTTGDGSLAARIRLLQNFGFEGYDQVGLVGTNAKMHEASAAMALTSLETFDAAVERNRGHYLDYLQELGEIPGMEPVRFDERERANYRYVVFEIEPERFGASRDDLVRLLHAENVLARRYFFPGCHRMAPYRDRGPDAGHRLPVTERLASSTLCLPTGDQLGPGAVAAIGSILRTAHIHAGQLRRQLAERSRRRHR